MSPRADRLFQDALSLPDRERADLAGRLIDTLDSGADADAQAAWAVEVERRLAELDAGEVTPVPWPIARRRILGQADGHSEG